MSENKCVLTDAELHEAVQRWVSKLCETGGRAWTLSVPVNFDRDPDMLITELCKRHEALLARHNEIVTAHAALLINHTALVEAVKKYFKSECLEILKREARAEVGRLIANEASADCEGEG